MADKSEFQSRYAKGGYVTGSNENSIKWHLITPEYIISPAELRDLEKRANGTPNHLSD